MKTIQITKLNLTRNGWVDFKVKGTGIIGQAKVYGTGDAEDGNWEDYKEYGVRPTSKVSKLWMALTPTPDRRMVVYEWERGSEIEENEIFDTDLLNDILDDLDSI